MVPTRPSPTFSFEQVDGLALEAFGRIELEHLARPHHIDRAHFGDHVGRDQHDDLVEPFLRRLGLRHDLAEPPEQNTRAEGGCNHQAVSSMRSRIRPVCH